MTDEKLAAAFRYHYGKPGGMHWVFNGMQECVNAWKKWGLDCLPNATPGALALLEPDLIADDAWHAQLREKLRASGG